MGSTVIAKVAVSAMVADSGKVFYSLWCEAWDKKSGRGDSSFSAMTFGSLATCLKDILAQCASCEGGILQAPDGHTTPEALLKQWRQALAKPRTMKVNPVSVRYGNGRFDLEPKWKDRIDAILRRHGLPAAEDRLQVDPRTHPEVIEDILQLEDVEYPWRIGGWELFDKGCFHDATVPSLLGIAQYAPTLVQDITPPLHLELRTLPSTPETLYWLRDEQGWRHLGWQYAAIEQLIATVVAQSEINQPGTAEACIAQIRAKVLAAPTFERGTQVRIAKHEDDDWRRRDFERLAASANKDPLQQEITLPIEWFIVERNAWALSQLNKAVSFELPLVADQAEVA